MWGLRDEDFFWTLALLVKQAHKELGSSQVHSPSRMLCCDVLVLEMWGVKRHKGSNSCVTMEPMQRNLSKAMKKVGLSGPTKDFRCVCSVFLPSCFHTCHWDVAIWSSRSDLGPVRLTYRTRLTWGHAELRGRRAWSKGEEAEMEALRILKFSP